MLQFFPTTVVRCRLPDFEHLDSGLLEYIDSLRDLELSGRRISNVLGWQSGGLDFDVPAVAEFATLVLEKAREYGRAHSWNFPSHMQLVIRETWANVNIKYAYNEVHNHPNSLLSGLYYLKAERDCGDLLILDPRKQASMIRRRAVRRLAPESWWITQRPPITYTRSRRGADPVSCPSWSSRRAALRRRASSGPSASRGLPAVVGAQ